MSTVAILAFILVFPWGALGIRKQTNITTEVDIERVRKNVGQLFTVLTIADPERPIEVKLPLCVGSCFAVSGDGYLVTNKHVIKHYRENQDEYEANDVSYVIVKRELLVCFGREPADRYEAKVVHECPYLDVAVIKVENKHFAEPFGILAKDAPVGRTVYACGFPGTATQIVTELEKKQQMQKWIDEVIRLRKQGEADFMAVVPESSFEVSITKGIVSAKRTIKDKKWLQTDAAVNRGNSGGPLIDSQCNVIGIITLGHSSSEATNFCLQMEQVEDELSPWVTFDTR